LSAAPSVSELSIPSSSRASQASLTGRTILVTGGSSGSGLAGAIAWTELGAQVVLGSRSEDRYRDAAARLPAGSVHPFIADLGDPESIDGALDQLELTERAPTDIAHCAAGGLEPMLRPLLRATTALRRRPAGPERAAALAKHREEMARQASESAALAWRVNVDGPKRLIARLAPRLPDGARIISYASIWSALFAAGAYPAFYRAVAESKDGLEAWFAAEAPGWSSRRISLTVLIGHILSDTSTGMLIDRNLAPLMAAEDQPEFRSAYISTADITAAATRVLAEPDPPTGVLRRLYVTTSGQMLDKIPPRVAAIAARVPF
jgi:NAD(P)-dependent dehydrogenase (short-subunit alcohol dehydrogenase family)